MSTIVHAIFGYFFLLMIVRVLSRRPGGQMTIFEFVIVFLIGGVIILSTVGNDRSVTKLYLRGHRGRPHAPTCLLGQGTKRDLRRHRRRNPAGSSQNGEWQAEAMKRMHIAPEDVMAAARTKGVRRFADSRPPCEGDVLDRGCHWLSRLSFAP